jgi:hypothetical protein
LQHKPLLIIKNDMDSFYFLGVLYRNVENWPDVKSLPSQLGQIGGIALSNGNDQLVVFHRGSRKWESQ